MNKEGEASDDIVNKGGTLCTAAQKYVNKKNSEKERRKQSRRQI